MLLKLTPNALGMLLARYRAVFNKCFLKNAAVLAAAGLICCAAPAAAQVDYVDFTGVSSGSYADLDTLRQDGITFNDGDKIIMHGDDNSLTGELSFGGQNVTIDFQGMPITITPSTTGNYFLKLAGGVVTFDNASKATINGFARSAAGSGTFSAYGGAVYLNNSEFNADGATFESNSISSSAGYRVIDSAYGYGGAVALRDSSTLNANGATFKSNSAVGTDSTVSYGAGGAVSVSSSKLYAEDAIFVSNSASASGTSAGYARGGAVYLMSNSDLYADGAAFESNSATGSSSSQGGALYLQSSGILFAEDAIFKSNYTSSLDTSKSSSVGGAVYLYHATLNAKGANFESNYAEGVATGKGGAVYLSGAELKAEDAIFKSNYATGSDAYGGAVALDDNSVLNAKGATFESNNATSSGTWGYGGAIYASASELNADGANFTNNTASTYGGAIYARASVLNAKGATFESNSATGSGSNSMFGYGGAILASDSELNVEGANFVSNTALNLGGAIHASNSELNAEGANFTNNTASTYGGAIYASVSGSASQTTTINLGAAAGQVSTFSGNTANGQANSIYFTGQSDATNVLTVDGEGTLDMRDPMNSSSGTYNIDITKTGTGTWKLDGDNVFNAIGTTGTTFAVNAGTLELYEDASITINKGSFTVGDNATFSLVAGTSPAVVAENVSFDSGSSLNVGGYSGSQEGDTVTLVQSANVITSMTNHYTIGGNTGVDYFTALVRLSDDNTAVLADVGLTWYNNSQDFSNQYDKAHGTFTIDGASNSFTLGTGLEDRSGTFTTNNWDGTTLTKAGDGTLILTGNNTYTGDTIIEEGTLTIENVNALSSASHIENSSVLNLFASSTASSTYNINSYSGSGVVGIKASLTASDQWSDLLNFSSTPQNSVNVHFYFADGSNVTYLPDGGLQFAHLSTNNGTDSTFALNGISSLAGASELSITTSNYQDYFLDLVFNPSLAKVYSKASAGELAQASWMHNRDLFKATGEAARQADKNAPGTYVGFGRNDLRHETGSYADIKGNTLTVALALQADDNTAWGIFGRKFDGSYTTSHKATLASGDYTVHSDGDLKTHDFGLFAEYRPQWDTELGSYYQGIVRAGRSTNDFSTATVYGPSTFRSGRSLFGFSLGGGYVKDIGRSKSADYYSHLIYTRLDGDSVTDSIGQRIKLESSDSVRLMSGVQFNFNRDRTTQTYIGAALDYEFRGKVDTRIDGLKADGAHLKGLTGMLEVGMSTKGSDTLTLDLSLQGYVGKKEGLGGIMSLSWQF